MGRVDVEWRKGDNGLGGTYTFSLRPSSIERAVPGQKLVEFKIPLMSGSITQQLGLDSRVIRLRGFLEAVDSNYDILDEKRRNLISGLDRTQPGQLHLISNLGNPESKHIYYKGIVRDIQFEPQSSPKLIEYSIEILCSDPTEYIV